MHQIDPNWDSIEEIETWRTAIVICLDLERELDRRNIEVHLETILNFKKVKK
jgi:hypothetical protein